MRSNARHGFRHISEPLRRFLVARGGVQERFGNDMTLWRAHIPPLLREEAAPSCRSLKLRRFYTDPACTFLCAALRDESSVFQCEIRSDRGKTAWSRLGRSRRMGGMFLR